MEFSFEFEATFIPLLFILTLYFLLVCFSTAFSCTSSPFSLFLLPPKSSFLLIRTSACLSFSFCLLPVLLRSGSYLCNSHFVCFFRCNSHFVCFFLLNSHPLLLLLLRCMHISRRILEANTFEDIPYIFRFSILCCHYKQNFDILYPKSLSFFCLQQQWQEKSTRTVNFIAPPK